MSGIAPSGFRPMAFASALKAPSVQFASVQFASVQGSGFAPALLSQRLADTTFVVFDTETTGFDPNQEDLTEISAFKVKNGQVIEEFSTLVKPNKAISEEITRITNITNEMVANAPTQLDALTRFNAFVGDAPVWVGHYANFDVNFIKTKSQQVGLTVLGDKISPETALCTKTLAQIAIPGLESYSLKSVIPHYGIVNDGAHRARNDVKATSEFLTALIRDVQGRGTTLNTLGDLVEYQGPIVKGHKDVPAKLAAAAKAK